MSATVLIVDDHAGFRANARRMLEADGYDVVGEAVDGSSGLAAARELRPAVVLLDVQLPDIDGAEVARQLDGCSSRPAVILISTRSESELGPVLAGCGACGFISKEELSGASVAGLLAETRSGSADRRSAAVEDDSSGNERGRGAAAPSPRPEAPPAEGGSRA